MPVWWLNGNNKYSTPQQGATFAGSSKTPQCYILYASVAFFLAALISSIDLKPEFPAILTVLISSLIYGDEIKKANPWGFAFFKGVKWLFYMLIPVMRVRASRYIEAVFWIISVGSGGAGAVLFQSRPSR